MSRKKMPEINISSKETSSEPTIEVVENSSEQETSETPDNLKRETGTEKQETADRIEKTREQIKRQQKKNQREKPYADECYGEFFNQADKAGKIVLDKEQNQALARQAKAFTSDKKFTLPHLALGGKTATEYASRARNFSTETKIVTLPDGRKVFMVYNYPASGIHRELDAVGKWTAGARMRKAKRADWKTAFEQKSNIPTIKCDDPNTVLMPYIENANANDVFAFNHEIDNFGKTPEFKEYGFEEKMELADKIVDELAQIHKKGIAWGEAILANTIIAKDGRPIIVDPETSFNKNVPLVEGQARDLRDMIQSVVSALRRSEKEIDPAAIVERMVKRHPDREVRAEIKRLSREKISWLRKLMRPFHEFPRLGANAKDYEAVLEAINNLE